MLRQVVARQAPEALAAAAALLSQQARGFFVTVEFSEDVSGGPKGSKTAPNIAAEWGKAKASTEDSMKMLQLYKDLGDFEGQPYLKFHNPRTFEDLDKPVPNFKAFGLKAGEVPRFFDNVLRKRADEAVELKGKWWDARRDVVKEGVAEKAFKPFAKLPVPEWKAPGAPVTLTALKGVTDTYYKQLEPSRKLRTPSLPAAVGDQLAALSKSIGDDGASLKQLLEKAVAERSYVEVDGKPAPDFEYTSAADAARLVNERRKAVHARWVKLWAKRVLAQPEQALVPLKERDALLASKHEDVGSKYDAKIAMVGRGPQTYGERLAACAAVDSFFLRRGRDEIRAMFPASAEEKEAAELAARLEGDKAWALEQLLGPAIAPEGASNRLKSEEARALAEHLYTPDRYFYQEGIKLAERYEEEERQLAEELKRRTGSSDGLLAAQRSPRTPLQALAGHAQEVAGGVAALKQRRAEAHALSSSAYEAHAIDKQIAFLSDPSNVSFEELELPQLVRERYEIEMAELDAEEAKLNEAEEEELWALTLAQQARHLQQHLAFDLPQAAYAHMDPVLYKKIDWELTHGLDLLHHEVVQGADCEQGEYVKDQLGVEALSHHLLPLLRYRRKKYRAKYGYFAAELSALPVKATLV